MDTKTSVYDALDDAKALYYTYKQDVNDSNAKHLVRNFKSIVAVIEHQGGTMFADDALLTHEREMDEHKIGVKDGRVS